MLTATLLALGAALLHATWNFIVKGSEDRDAATWAMWLLGGSFSIPILVVIGLPDSASWPFLAGSATIHIVYALTLSRAYTHGDFSLAYPIARGSGSLLVALGGTVLLGDHLTPLAWTGIIVVALSLVLLVSRGASVASLRWAVFTGFTIACYMLLDGQGTRRSSSGLAYGLAVQVGIAVTLTVSGLVRGRRADLVTEFRRQPYRLAVAGTFVVAAYTMVLIGFHYAPVGYVSVLRESSVLIGAVLGWVFLHERFGRHRAISASVMVLGMCLLILGG